MVMVIVSVVNMAAIMTMMMGAEDSGNDQDMDECVVDEENDDDDV